MHPTEFKSLSQFVKKLEKRIEKLETFKREAVELLRYDLNISDDDELAEDLAAIKRFIERHADG